MADAVSFRYGDTTEHRNFKGVKGEITVDTEAQTVWVHVGNNEIGKPLARADLDNVDTAAIANKNIARTDLSNVYITNPELIRNKFNSLNYADKNLNNVTTSDIRTKLDTVYVATDLSNLNKAALVDKLDDTFVTTDLANVTSQTIENKGIAKSDLTNVAVNTIKNKGIASNTLDNVTLNDATRTNLDLQKASNIISVSASGIIDNGTYPTAYSVRQALDAIPPMITNMVVDTLEASPTLGQITITVSKSLSVTPVIKELNGQILSGTWVSGANNTWVFTPENATVTMTIITANWIITIA